MSMKDGVMAAILAFVVHSTAIADQINWVGCGVTKKAYLTELADAFEKLTGIVVVADGGGATKGIRNVAHGEFHMGGSCRLQLRDRAGKVNPLEADTRLHQVAWDAIVVIVHPSNIVSNISMDNLRKVYKGEISNWKQLGGDDHPITLVARAGKDSGVGYMFRRYAFSDPDVEFPKSTTFVLSTGPLERVVETDPHAIGVDGVSSARKSAVNILSLDGVEPSKKNIGAGKYYMFRPLFLTTDKVTPDPNTLVFVEFALSEEGQKIISDAGTVNLEEGARLNSLWEIRKTKLGL